MYSSPRYSNDIDFVDLSIPNIGISNYTNKLETIGKNYNINKIKIMSSGLGVRSKWGNQKGKMLAKVEIESRATDDLYYMSSGKFRLLTKSPEDIYKDKIFANISRFSNRKNTNGTFPFKPNDFFDLNYLSNTLNITIPNREQILQRAEQYDRADLVNNENLNEMISLITNKENFEFFKNCLKKITMPDFFKLIKFDKKYFNTVAEHFENYKT